MSGEILLVTSWRDEEIENQFELGRELEKREHTVHVFSPRPVTQRDHELSGMLFTPDETTHAQLPTVSELEREYDIPSIPHLYFTEMKYFALSRSEAIARTRRFARALMCVFETTDVDYVYQGRGGEIHRLLAYYFVQEAGGKNVWGEFSPFDDRLAFSTRLNGTWDRYETIPDSEIPSGDRAKIDEYIDSFRSKKKVYTHGKEKDDNSVSITDTMSTAISSLRTVLCGTTPNNPYRYGARKLTKVIKKKINSQMLPSITESRKQCRTNQFVFFPLQYPYESRLTVFSPEFFKQSFLVEYLSRILPQGVELFVKQHPNHPGKQSPAWIRRVENHDRVTVLNPAFNAHEAVDHAESVVVTNNTVGFEALFHNTPLVVLGRAFYEDVPAVAHVKELSTLPASLADALDRKITDSTVRSSIYSLQEATYPVAAPHSDQRAATSIDAFQSFIDSYT